MTYEEQQYFRNKARDYYGTGAGPTDRYGRQLHKYDHWKDIVRDYRNRANQGMTVNPDAFSYGDPLGLLGSKADMDAVLRDPTKRDYIKELDRMAPNRLQGPGSLSFKDRMRTSGIPYDNSSPQKGMGWFSNPRAGYSGKIESEDQRRTGLGSTGNLISRNDKEYFKNIDRWASRMQDYKGVPDYYLSTGMGDQGRMSGYGGGHQGVPPPGIISPSLRPGEGMGAYPDANQRYHPLTRGMSGSKMNSLLDSGDSSMNQVNTNKAGWTKDQMMDRANKFRMIGLQTTNQNRNLESQDPGASWGPLFGHELYR